MSGTKTDNLADAISADDALNAFLENPENKRLFRESEIRLAIAEFMRSLRKSQGITQETLAERVGCSQSFIAKLEKGAYDRFGLSSLRTYARALGYDIDVEKMFRPIGQAEYTGSSSSAFIQESLEYEEQLSLKMATAFAHYPISDEDVLDKVVDLTYDSAA